MLLRFFCALFMLASFTTLFAADYYVAPTGSDANPGTLESPFATIQKAADVMQAGDVCYIRKGIYRETVKPAASGTMGSPIRFEAYENEEVTVTGTQRISESAWAAQDNGIYAADVSALGNVTQVFADWDRMEIARFPNNESHNLLSPTLGEADDADAVEKPALSELYDDQLDGAIDWTGADLWLLAGRQWVAFVTPVEAHNGNAVSFKAELGIGDAYIPEKGSRYFITGTLDALDAEGEWFYDEQEKMLYFKAPGNVDPSTLNVDVRIRSLGFNLTNRKHIQVDGITFFAANVTMERAGDCLLTRSRVFYPVAYYDADAWSTTETPQNSRGAGVRLGGENNTVSDCEIAYSWGDGVTIYGQANRLENCLVHDVCWACADAAAVHTSGRDHVILHNSLYNAARSGLVHRKSKALEIGYNEIYDCGLICTDLGATYCWNTDGEGTIIHHNFVHHVRTSAHTAGIYLDNNSRDFLVHHNVVWKTDDIGIQTNLDAHDHQIYNNTIWDCASAMGGGGGNNQLVNQVVYNNLSNSSSWFGTDVQHNLAIADPKFVDEENGDFRLQKDSPARDDYVIPVRLMNGGFENGTGGWNGGGAEIRTVTEPVHSGKYACQSYNRDRYWEGLRQSITDILKRHGEGYYKLVAWVKLPEGADPVTAYLRMKIVDDTGDDYPGIQKRVTADEWTKLTMGTNMSWQGEVQEAVYELMTTNDDNLTDFYIDDCAVIAPEGSGGTGETGGILIPGITDDVTDGKPDAGAGLQQAHLR